MIRFVLSVMLLMVACNHEEVKNNVSKAEACGYPQGCYCQPINEDAGLLVSRDGRASLGPVMCLPDGEDLGRHDSFCLPVVGESQGVMVVDGRVSVEKPGHTHDVQSSAPVRCEVR